MTGRPAQEHRVAWIREDHEDFGDSAPLRLEVSIDDGGSLRLAFDAGVGDGEQEIFIDRHDARWLIEALAAALNEQADRGWTAPTTTQPRSGS